MLVGWVCERAPVQFPPHPCSSPSSPSVSQATGVRRFVFCCSYWRVQISIFYLGRYGFGTVSACGRRLAGFYEDSDDGHLPQKSDLCRQRDSSRLRLLDLSPMLS